MAGNIARRRRDSLGSVHPRGVAPQALPTSCRRALLPSPAAGHVGLRPYAPTVLAPLLPSVSSLPLTYLCLSSSAPALSPYLPPSRQLVKVICKAPTFMAAVQKMQRALYEFHIRGIKVGLRLMLSG